MRQSLTDALGSVVAFVPKLALFLLVLVVGLLVARALAKGVDKLLERVGFDRAVERGGLKKALARSSLDASAIVGRLVWYALALFVLQLAFSAFGPNPVSDLLTRLIAYLPQVLLAIVLLVVVAAVAKAVRDLVTGTLSGLSYGRTLGTVAGALVLGLGVVAALGQLGVATAVTTPVLVTVLATVGGILVVGVGGGLVRPMQSRWEGWLATAERESPVISARVAAAAQAREQARVAAELAEAERRAEQERIAEEHRREAARIHAAASAPAPVHPGEAPTTAHAQSPSAAARPLSRSATPEPETVEWGTTATARTSRDEGFVGERPASVEFPPPSGYSRSGVPSGDAGAGYAMPGYADAPDDAAEAPTWIYGGNDPELDRPGPHRGAHPARGDDEWRRPE